jgi:4-hydroxy-2-oxoheptanedioate aldolase
MRHLRAALDGERPLIGLWASIPSTLTAEATAAAGADYIVVDQQHGAVEPGALLAMLQAIAAGGAPSMVRVAANDPFVIGHALDVGAHGVIVPMVDDGAAAARAVAACRYAPEGVRSFGALRGGGEGARPLCLVMIETRAGLEAVDEIAATPGLDGIYIGPSDLSLSLGLQPTLRLEHPPILRRGRDPLRAALPGRRGHRTERRSRLRAARRGPRPAVPARGARPRHGRGPGHTLSEHLVRDY